MSDQKQFFTFTHPFTHLIILCFTALLTFLFKFSETQVLYFILSYFAVLVFIHPLNGIYFLITVLPLFLGNSKRPFFMFLEYFVYLTLISSLIHYLFKPRKINVSLPIGQLALIFVIISLMSLPVNFKDVYYFIRGTPILETVQAFLSSNEILDIYFLRSLMNLVSAFGLFVVIGIFMESPENIIRIFKMFLIVSLISMFFGFAFRFEWFYHQTKPFLSLQLWGMYGITAGKTSLTGFAFNSGYWGQYLIVCTAFNSYFLLSWRENKIWALFALISIACSFVMIPLTYQRGPVVALGGMIFLCILYALWSSENRKKIFLIASVSVFALVVLFALVDYILTGGSTITRMLDIFNNPSLRDKVWRVAWAMFQDRPFFGVGLGKFHYSFPLYCESASVDWNTHVRFVRTTAHNLYLHILAEQGLIGFMAFLALIFFGFFNVFKKH